MSTRQALAHDPFAAARALRRAVRRGWTLASETLLGRFLSAAAVLLVSLALLAWVMNARVHKSSRDHAANLAERYAANNLLRDIGNDLWRTEQALQTFLLMPSADTRREYESLYAQMVAGVGRLGANSWIAGSASLRDKAVQVHRDLERLRDSTTRLMDVRTDPNRMFPAMPVMFARMQPRAEEFFATATLALDEARERLAQPYQAEVLALFYDTLYAWSRTIDAFRLYISNRLGIFDVSVDQAMRVQDSRAADFAERVGRNLERLGELDRQGALEFQQQLSLAEMRTLLRDWLAAWKEARRIWTSDRWRSDTLILQDEVRPLLAGSWRNLQDLQKAVDEHSGEDLATMARLATTVTDWLWVLVLFGSVLAMIMVLFFEHQIRKPIARVVSALKAEVAGDPDIVVPETGLIETRDLAEAFDRMRHEVQIRQEALNAREQRLSTILNNTAEGIITFDEFGGIVNFNQSAERLFGWSESEVLGTSFALLIAPESRETRDDYLKHFLRSEIQRLIGHEGELVGRHRDGSMFPMAIKVRAMMLEGRQKYVAMVSNISERKALMEHLRRLAEHDGLTGLYNRSYFQAELERLVERVRRSEAAQCALLYIDLDHFKYVNDTLGHAAGDKLLIEVAGLLGRRARKSDLVARLGGDEFTVLVYDTGMEQVELVADAFRRQLADYDFHFEGQTITLGCSIGVAMIDPAAASPAAIMSRADLSCHLAKRAGRNQVHVFSVEDSKNVATMSLDMGWSRRIREAIDKNRFTLACQPIVSTRTRRAHIYEVLIRMQDANGELIMPGGFLPTAERFGLSLDIDRWVIVNAIETLAGQRHAIPDLAYTINLSAQTLNTPAICDLVGEMLAATGLDPSALIFEITETAAIADMNAAAALLARLRALGCRTALDDFGSGMSSFAYLKDLPVDIVKIDGRFLKHIDTNPVDEAMVRAMNDIAHALGKITIAEFVESEAAFEKLVALGVDYGQGFHLGRPDLAAPCHAIAAHAGGIRACRR